MVGTLVGATIFLVLLLFAVQVVVRLYTTSVLTSAAFGAAQQVATASDQQGDVAAAEAAARARMGSFGRAHTTFIWHEVDAQQVVLEVQAYSPGFVPLPASYRRIDRTVSVRTERFR
ncbi:MAG TPA: hypothetical protein VG184_05695 [Acidimicrobiales bacterium]|nr:hypothetical protein [Acidimicrobiales bacterium]